MTQNEAPTSPRPAAGTTESASRSFGAAAIRHALREFGGRSDDLLAAADRSWLRMASGYVHAVRTDPVLRSVVDPLRGLAPDVASWWEDRRGGPLSQIFHGRQPYELPPPGERLASFVVRLLELFVDGSLTVDDIVGRLFGTPPNNTQALHRFADDAIIPTSRYIRSLLEAMLEEAERVAAPPKPSGNIYNTYVTAGPMVASPITIGEGHTVSTTTTAYAAATTDGREIMAWTDLLRDVDAHRHVEVAQALEVLARAADRPSSADPARVVQAAQIVATAAPSFRARAAAFASRTAGVVVTGAATAAAKAGVEHPDVVRHAFHLVLSLLTGKPAQ